MKTIDEIQAQLNLIADELEQWKKSEGADELNVDFAAISAQASRHPIKGHPLLQKDNYTKRKYLILLLAAAQYDNEHLEDSLLLAHRIAWGAEYDMENGNLNEEFIEAKLIKPEMLNEWSALFLNDDIKMVLVLEQLVMAGMLNKGKAAAIDFIAGLSTMLSIDKQKLTFLANFARVLLTDDLGSYNCNIFNEWNIFDCYLKNFKFKAEPFYVTVPDMLIFNNNNNNALFSIPGHRAYKAYYNLEKVCIETDRESKKIYVKQYFLTNLPWWNPGNSEISMPNNHCIIECEKDKTNGGSIRGKDVYYLINDEIDCVNNLYLFQPEIMISKNQLSKETQSILFKIQVREISSGNNPYGEAEPGTQINIQVGIASHPLASPNIMQSFLQQYNSQR